MKFWRPRSTSFIVGGMLLVVLATAVLFALNTFQSTVMVTLGSSVYKAKPATTQVARQQGLSGVEKLGDSEGLLMVYATDSAWPVYIRDMKVPIDIIWLSKDKKVVYIVRNAKPDEGKIFTPKDKARYVLQIPAGGANESAAKLGMAAVFSIDESGVE